MEFRILGPLQIVDGEREFPLGSPKERALLAVLLLHAGEVVSRERLIDELWGEAPPPTAAKALNVYVSQLRKALDGEAAIATRPPGYAIDVDALDAKRFEALTAEARELVATGDVKRARELFAEALGLWRGPALAGVELESTTRTEVSRLEELRLAALMDRIDCDLALRRHEQVIGELETLVAQHPLHERLRGQLILALYRAGRQSDALAAYRDARETLVDELGIEPSAPLQRLEKAVLNQDPSLELPTGVARDDHREPRPRRRTRSRLVVAAVIVAAGVAAVVATYATRTSSVPVRPNSLAVIDPRDDAVVADVRLSTRPGPLAVDGGNAWIGNVDDSTLSRLDVRRRTVSSTTPLSTQPAAIVVRGGSVWIAGNAALVAVAAGSPTTYATVPVENGLSHDHELTSVTAGAGSIWTAAERYFIRVDATRRRQTGLVFFNGTDMFGVGPATVAFAAGSLWAGTVGAGDVFRYDPHTLELRQTIPVAGRPNAIAVSHGALWVTTTNKTLVRIPATAAGTDTAVSAVVHLPAVPVGVAASRDGVWVAEADGTVERVDPRTARVVARIRLGKVLPAAIAAGAGEVWVTAQAPPPTASG